MPEIETRENGGDREERERDMPGKPDGREEEEEF
jgi:hypothetical protein